MQNCDNAGRRQLEDDAPAVGSSRGCCAVKITVGALNYRTQRPGTVSLIELIDSSEFPGGRYLEYRPTRIAGKVTTGDRLTAQRRGAIEVSICCLHQGGFGIVAPGSVEGV